MFLVAAAPDFRRVTIQSVADGTPAAEAGLSKGDEIVAIDGCSTAGRTLDDVREQFKTVGATRRIDVKQDTEQRAAQLAVPPLV
jgi:C-terminal processing protease CtpA/Prc